MNDTLIRKFCETRYHWPIVGTATLLLGLVVVVPLADDYFDKRTARNTLAEELVRARQTADMLPDFEKRVESVAQQLSELEARTVGRQRVGAYRSRVIELARESECQVRKIEVSNAVVQPWNSGDQVLNKTPKLPNAGAQAAFNLERRSMRLTVDGSMASLQALLKKLEEENSLAHPRLLELHSKNRTKGSVSMDVEVWLFNLARKKA